MQCAKSTPFGDNHWWSAARKAAKKRDRYACRLCGARRRDGAKLQVHHIVPCEGRHSVSGCHHHVDGLVTLCEDCHHDVHVSLRNGQVVLVAASGAEFLRLA